MARNATTTKVIDYLLDEVARYGKVSIQVTDNCPLDGYFSTTNKIANQIKQYQLIEYMVSRGLVQKHQAGDQLSEKYYSLTMLGKARLAQRDFAELAIPTPSFWDQQWRLVFFDIPETQRKARQLFTAKLRLLGFQPVQRSVWVHPFPCQSILERVVTMYEIKDFVTLVVASQIDNQQQLREQFRDVLRTVPSRSRIY